MLLSKEVAATLDGGHGRTPFVPSPDRDDSSRRQHSSPGSCSPPDAVTTNGRHQDQDQAGRAKSDWAVRRD